MILILDTETTGISTCDRIVSISWALFRNDSAEVYSACHIVQPVGFTIPAGATVVHGITTAYARQHGEAIDSVLGRLYNDIALHRPRLYVGHNVAFDKPILLNEYARLNLVENISGLPTFCTMKETTNLCRLPHHGRGGYKWPKLGELHRHLFGCAHSGAHDARADVRATAKCFFALVERRMVRCVLGEEAAVETSVVLKCPHCSQGLRFAFHGKGVTLRCPSCTRTFDYPA